jgi:hypothetical protein
MFFLARARQECIGWNVEGNAISDHRARPHFIASRVTHQGAILVIGVVAPERDEPFDLHPIRECVTTAQLHLILNRVIDGTGIRSEHGATATLWISVETHARDWSRRIRDDRE